MTRDNKNSPSPCVLLIGGLDPSGGAGLAADQRACRAAGAWPLPVASMITVQSTTGLHKIHPLPPSLVIAQAERVLRDQHVRAIKIGALGSRSVVHAVLTLLHKLPNTIPVVLDPVIGATRGPDDLLSDDALHAISLLANHCTVVTPNRDEASTLSGVPVTTPRSARQAAISLQKRGPSAVLVKGGHLSGPNAVDWLATSTGITKLASKRLDLPAFHGSGCTMASLIAAHLAVHGQQTPNDTDLIAAVRYAKRKMSHALRHAHSVGRGLLVLPV